VSARFKDSQNRLGRFCYPIDRGRPEEGDPAFFYTSWPESLIIIRVWNELAIG
jgi:hypothetical protein